MCRIRASWPFHLIRAGEKGDDGGTIAVDCLLKDAATSLFGVMVQIQPEVIVERQNDPNDPNGSNDPNDQGNRRSKLPPKISALSAALMFSPSTILCCVS